MNLTQVPQQGRDAGKLPAHASHSSIELWSSCGKRYFLQKIQKVPEPPAWYLIGGSAVHLATEWLDTGTKKDPGEAWDEAFDSFVEAAHQTGVSEEDWLTGFAVRQRQEYWREKGRQYVEQWITRENPPFALVEMDVSTTLPSGLHIKAYVDRVTAPDDDNVVQIWDLKTGSKRPESEQQLAIYKVLFEQMYPDYTVGRVGNYMFKDDLVHFYDVDNWSYEGLDKLASDWMAGVSAGLFIPKRGSACRTCSVRAACLLESGDTEITRLYDPLNPHYTVLDSTKEHTA